MIKQIRDWLQHVIDNFNCGLHGHSEVVILQQYEPEVRARNFCGNDLKKLSRTAIHEEKIFVEKCKCLTCGEIFLRQRREPVWPRHGGWQ